MPKTGMPVEKIDRRLMAVADFVRPGAVVADIGTDHAYLPVFLISHGKAVRAVAADINRGPLDRADKNIAAAALKSLIETRLADGLEGLDRLGITDICICGMGGELIEKIIEKAVWTQNNAIRLILQPMTKAETLRAYLISNGFSIIGEKLAEEDRIYQIVCAVYTGENTTYTDTELLLGRYNIARNDELFRRFAAHTLTTMKTRLNGKLKAGADTIYEDGIIRDINSILQ